MSDDETFIDTGSGAPVEATLDAGDRIGEYTIAQLLGRGAMGEVYEAEHSRLGRHYAMKVLPVQLASDPSFRERFEREARTLAALEHPNIVNVAYAGEDSGRFYLVMELLGPFFDDENTFPLAEDDARRVVGGVLSALDYAHGKGIVHRDLKPANLLRAPDGSAKVADFGVALVVGEAFVQTKLKETIAQSRLGEAGTVAGTPQPGQTDLAGTLYYMAPEVVEGRQADARSDLYAVGFMTYEMLTGRKPIGMFRPPTHYQPRLAPGWDGLIGSLLEADPEDRPTSAANALARMQDPGFASGAGVTPPPVSPVTTDAVTSPQSPKKGSLWPKLVAALLLMAGVAAGAYFGMPYLTGDAEDGNDRAKDTAQDTEPTDADEAAASSEGEGAIGSGSATPDASANAGGGPDPNSEAGETIEAGADAGQGTETGAATTVEEPEVAPSNGGVAGGPVTGGEGGTPSDPATVNGVDTTGSEAPESAATGQMPEMIQVIQSSPDTGFIALDYGSNNGARPNDALTLYDDDGRPVAELLIVRVQPDRSVAQVLEGSRTVPEAGSSYQLGPKPPEVPAVEDPPSTIAGTETPEEVPEETVRTPPPDTTEAPAAGTPATQEGRNDPLVEGGERVLISGKTYYSIRVDNADAQVILATTRAEKSAGLSGVTTLAGNRGLLYLFENTGRWTFSAANTQVNLDIGFFDAEGRLLETRPMPARNPDPISPGSGDVRYVLTIREGWFNRNGLRPGARLNFDVLEAALRAKGADPAAFLPTNRGGGTEDFRSEQWYALRLAGRNIQARLAVTEDEQRRGLSELWGLPEDGGMLYVFRELRRWTFSAAETDLAIDIGFFDTSGTLLEVRSMLPRDATPIAPASDRVRFVLEMESGWFARNRIFRGARLDLESVRQALMARGFDPNDYRAN
ncbi:MAG: DUF192 domain-containing protein [Opitutales bacterium]